MRRPVGVMVAGVVLLFCGLCGLLLMGIQMIVMLLTHTGSAALVPHGELVLLIFDGFLFALSLLSGWTGIALFRMRTWARYVAIVLAVLAACFTGLTTMVCLLLRQTALPLPDLRPGQQQQVFAIVAFVYGVMMLIAVYWIIYFNLARVRLAFAQAAAVQMGEDAYGRLTLRDRLERGGLGFAQVVVWIVGVLLLAATIPMVLLAWRQMPVFLLGWIATGLSAMLIDLLWAALLLYAGLGLLLRWPTGWKIAVGLQLYSLLSVFLLLIPAYAERMMQGARIVALHDSSYSSASGLFTSQASLRILTAGSALGGALALVILLALVRCRHRYLQPR